MPPTAISDHPPRFAVDAMLGRLARWLRALGYDASYHPECDDHDLVRMADGENRILLTRDRHLVTFLKPRQSVLVTSAVPISQLRQVSQECELTAGDDLFNRCLLCNTRLREATDTEIQQLVPPASRRRAGPFLRCPGCGRVYWPGSHVKRMRDTLGEVFPELVDLPASERR